MKIRNITVEVKTPEEALGEFAAAYRAAERGEKPAGPRDGIYFASLDALRKVLTPKRLALLRLIRLRNPESVYGLARAAGRGLKNVQDDVALLARIGLVSLRRTRTARPRVVPRVSYDRLQLQIPVA